MTRHLTRRGALAATALLARSAFASTRPVNHAGGHTEVPLHPQRVLVFDLGLLDSLDTLGVPVLGVPDWPMPPPLARYGGDAYLKPGTLFVPDEAAIAAVRPDLILIGGRMRDRYARLAALAPTLDLSNDSKAFDRRMAENAQVLGRVFEREAEVTRRLASLRASTAALKARAAQAGRALTLMVMGGQLHASGPGSRFGVLHDRFGLPPADARLGTSAQGQVVSAADVAQLDPDWLFVIDRDAAVGTPGPRAAELLDQPAITRSRAAQAGRIVQVDGVPLYLTSGGLRSEQRWVDSLLEALNRPSR